MPIYMEISPARRIQNAIKHAGLRCEPYRQELYELEHYHEIGHCLLSQYDRERIDICRKRILEIERETAEIIQTIKNDTAREMARLGFDQADIDRYINGLPRIN